MRELERDYARWEQVYGGIKKDPFWPDGVNANLCRDHILCGKKTNTELYPDAEMPEIYYWSLPQKLPVEYMARKEEIWSAALRSYTRYISPMKISVYPEPWSGFLKRMLWAVYWTHYLHGPMF